MNRGFIFILDAFIALVVVIAFVGTLSQFSRDYSYLQDETLYSYGRSIMDILLYHEITLDDGFYGGHKIPLIHALRESEAEEMWSSQINPLIPPQIGYSIEYYTGSKWKPFGDTYVRKKEGARKSVAVVSTVPVIVKGERIQYPYTYGNYCPPSGGTATAGANVCALPTELYTPDEFATGNYGKAPYGATFVRVVVEV
ncbi:MAG: hypothetical protein N3H30_02805 [Candidatus Micrarchaeota archaeon]|nr:hypothetical protein [Candidatus Micrarchaeota archaeon]